MKARIEAVVFPLQSRCSLCSALPPFALARVLLRHSLFIATRVRLRHGIVQPRVLLQDVGSGLVSPGPRHIKYPAALLEYAQRNKQAAGR